MQLQPGKRRGWFRPRVGADSVSRVRGDEVAELLLDGVRLYGVTATADVRPTGPGQWFVSIDADPDGIDLEVSEAATTVRVLWSGGTVDAASIGDALNYLAIEAGLLPRGHRARCREG